MDKIALKFKKITLHVNPLLITHVGMQRWIWILVNKFFVELGVGGLGDGGYTWPGLTANGTGALNMIRWPLYCIVVLFLCWLQGGMGAALLTQPDNAYKVLKNSWIDQFG